MIRRRQRGAVAFDRFSPTARDHGIGYSYIHPSTGREMRTGTDRWMRAKAHLAANALWTGCATYTVWGGAGDGRWIRTVTVSQEQAEAFLVAAADRNLTMRGTLRRALAARDRRLRAA